MPPDELIPMVMGVTVMLIPIIAILTAHQRKMTELMRGGSQTGDPALRSEIAALRAEIAALRQDVHAQALALDGARRLPTQEDLSARG
jgi:hypothetical protein